MTQLVALTLLSAGLAGFAGLTTRSDVMTRSEPPETATNVCASTHIEISRALVDELLAAAQKPTTTCNIIPAFEAGRSIGIKVFGVKPTSLLGRLCLRNGDLVTHVNGFALVDPDTSAHALASLRYETDADVDVRRKGVQMRLSYTIRP